MRKLISLTLALCFFLSLAGCSLNSENSKPKNKYGKYVEAANYTQDFKDNSGRIVYRIDITYPTLTKKADKEAIANLQAFNDEYIKYYIHTAEANVNNASAFMDNNDSDIPWLRKITYDMYYLDENVISFVENTEFSALGGDVPPTYEGYSVSLKNGKQLSVTDLAIDEPDIVKDAMMKAIVGTANKTYSENGFALDNAQIEILNSLYYESNFCISDSNISFIYSYKDISGGSRTGCYICEVPLTSVSTVIVSTSDNY